MDGVDRHQRAALGVADVDDERLRDMVAAQLDRPRTDVEVLSSRATVAPYDLDSITTAGRYWVDGEAQVDGATAAYRFFVKVMQSWTRSPFFEMVPPAARASAEALVPWRTEAAVYRSDLRRRLPEGLTMPRTFGVFDLDDRAASVWMEALDPPPQAVRWDSTRYALAGHLLGRLAASRDVAELAGVGGHDLSVHGYLDGRLRTGVLPVLHDEGTWHHPLIATSFDADLRQRLLGATDRVEQHADELAAMPTTTGHGDACTNNLLPRPDGAAGFALIDFNWWGELPLGFDLGQLLVGDVQLGRGATADLTAIDAVIVPAYVSGLGAEGCHADEAAVRRAHALQLLLFTALSSPPFEHLGTRPTTELHALGHERARLARFVLDLVDAT